MPHSIPHGDACFAYFNKIWGIPELDAKRLDLMSEIVPGASLFGVLVNPKYPPAINQARTLEAAATKIGRTLVIAEASDDAKLEAAFVALLQKQIGALVVASDPFFGFTTRAHHCVCGRKASACDLPIPRLRP